MPRALVLTGIAADLDLVASAVAAAGWEVQRGHGADALRAGDEAPDVIVSDVAAGARAGWLSADGSVPPPAPLVVMSRFEAFLANLPPTVSASLLLPANDAAVLDALERAGGDPRFENAPQAAGTVVSRVSRAPSRGSTAPANVADLPGPPPPLPTPRLFTPERDRALADRGLLDGAVDPALSSVAALVARGLGVPTGLVTGLATDWQHFLGHSGAPLDLAAAGGTLREWSFCQHAVQAGTPLVVEDAREHPMFRGNPLVEMGIVGAYAGVPIEVSDIGFVGTVCAISDRPRAFGDAELATLDMAAKLAGQLLSARPRRSDVKTAPVAQSAENRTPVATGNPAGARHAPPTAPTLTLPLPLLASDPPSQLRTGDVLGGEYWITAQLGAGGQARVYLARDRAFGRLVAIKVAPRESLVALEREGNALGNIRHTNILQVHARGRTAADEPYLVLEYVQGETVQARLDQARRGGGGFDVRQVTEVIRQLAGALATMHGQGFVHGDVKPSNVLLDPALDRAVLIDFGLGLALDAPDAPAPAHMHGGTPGYSAPEQLVHADSPPVSTAFDVYGLAALAYAMLTGVSPFEGPGGPLLRQLRDELVPLTTRRPDLPRAAGDLLARALAKDPARRPPSTVALSDALHKALAREVDELAATSTGPRVLTRPTPMSRGGVFRALRADVTRGMGRDVEARLFAAMGPRDRAVFDRALADATDAGLHPTSAIVAYLWMVSGGDVGVIDRLEMKTAADALRHQMRLLRVNASPEGVVGTASVLLERFHAWGRAEIERPAPDAARVLLVLPDAFAPMMCSYMGASFRTLLASTQRGARFVQSACMADGAARCVFQVNWDRL